MKRYFIWLIMAALACAVTGCGDGHDDRPIIERRIVSDAGVDGDIVEDTTGSRTVTLVGRDAVTRLRAGVDPSNDDEYRAFLDFPLGGIPISAIIKSATLNIIIRSATVLPLGADIPVRIELVSFDPPLVATDFDRAILLPLAATTIVPPITSNDVNREEGVDVNVTSLMVEAQLRRLPSFQIRILEDFGFVAPGLIEIDESSNDTAPLLTVVYF